MSELGHNPTSTEIKENDSVLFSAIDKFGGIRKIRQHLKLEDYQKADGYWTKKRVLANIKGLYKELGHVPTQNELCERELSVLISKINEYFGGLRQLREILGDKQLRVEDGHWTEERILDQAKKIVVKLGYFPSNRQLCEMGYAPLAAQIGRRKKGYRYFRGKLGLEQLSKPAGFWQDKENVLNEARRLYTQLGHFPTQIELGKLGFGSLYRGALDIFGGIKNLKRIVESGESGLEGVLENYVGGKNGK